MRKKLTPKLLDSLLPATGKRYEVRDELVTGLHIRVSNAGGKVWYVATRVDGVSRRIKLGTYPILSLKDAREKAQMILRDIQLGLFQQREEESEEKVLTLGDIIPQFIERYAKRQTKDWKGSESMLMRMEKLHRMRIDAIKRVDVVRELERLIADIGDNGGKGTRANRGLAAIKKLYSWCIDQGIVEVSPVTGLKPLIKEVARDRCLTDDEVIGFWKGCEAEGYSFEQFGKLLLLTGQRRDEIAAMRWSELDLHRGTLTLKADRTKNSTTHVVPLPKQALDILRSIPRFLGSDYVFTSTGRSSISGFGRFKKRLDTFVGLDAEDWRFHDLRRTAATNMAILKVQPHIIEAVLNHKSGIVSGVAATYNRHAYFDEKREALQLWANSLKNLAMEGETVAASHQYENLHRAPGSLSVGRAGDVRAKLER
ncbi:tyrosine-type recombinase/integrase [Ensifer soli]|uniref:tyrosine-type recombinase/integrase n=1 Tax=Ciceribacter sp. sgz301302 TaxID=3342379 RepID=UPI0035B87BA4